MFIKPCCPSARVIILAVPVTAPACARASTGVAGMPAHRKVDLLEVS
jgi:hypothetical protein